MKNLIFAWQIIICSLIVLPFPVWLYTSDSGVVALFAFFLILFTPPIVFWILFGTMKSGPGSDFKTMRVIVACLLWVIFCFILFFIQGLFLELSWWMKGNFGFDDFCVDTVLFTCYNLAAITATVILSYVIGKRVKTLSKE